MSIMVVFQSWDILYGTPAIFWKFVNLCYTFFDFLEKFNLNSNIVEQSKTKRNKICNDAYDRYWKNEIKKQNSKAISYCKFKNTIWLEPYLSQSLLNQKHKTAISRFRLSNHSLMIEKGRHAKPKKIERNERFCQFCEKNSRRRKTFFNIMPSVHPCAEDSWKCVYR